MSSTPVPLWATVRLTHAQLQAVADEVGVDLIHLKGPAQSEELGLAPRDSTDADVLVRPAHLERFLAGLTRHGWSLYTGFAEGSSFEHAANYRHPVWTFADVHRRLPGPTRGADEVFQRLWADRQPLLIAARRCWVPDLTGQVLVLTLHAARSHGREVPAAWAASPAVRQRAVRVLARDLGAEVALAAAVGELERFAGNPEHDLWQWWSGTTTADERLAEWAARWRSARSLRERGTVLRRIVVVNRTHLELRLGHAPSSRELAAAYAVRTRSGARALFSRLVVRRAGRLPRGDGDA
ncbi:hypothetical protein GCM10027053_10900 [Intrasporangium mesophilum]